MEGDGMRAWLMFIAGVFVAILAVWALAHVVPENWTALPAALYGVIAMTGGLGALWMRKRRERENRSAEEGSVEKEISERAASGTFQWALVAMVAFGLYLVLRGRFLDAFVLYTLIGCVFAAYWVRYSIIRNQLT
jgi:cobalamin synthase